MTTTADTGTVGYWRDRDYWNRHYEWRGAPWWKHDNGRHRGWYKDNAYERGYREGWNDRDDRRGGWESRRKGRGHVHGHGHH